MPLCFAQDFEQKNTAHLKVYPELDQLVKKAQLLEEKGNYAGALAIYEKALKERPNTMVPLTDEQAQGVWQYVLDRMAAWPEEARELRRRRVDPPARQLFQNAKRRGDIDALEELVGRYPLSSFVDDSLALIGNLRLDEGRPGEAARAFGRIGDPGPAVLARLGAALARLGRKTRVEALVERAGDAVVRIGGEEVKLADHLRTLAGETLVRREAADAPLAIPGWEMIGGAPSGSRLGESGVELGPLAWSVQVSSTRYQPEVLRLRRMPTLAVTPEFRPLFPAVADGILYVHNESTVTALSLGSRLPEPLWEHRVPPPAGEVMFDNRLMYATTVHDGRVFANLITAVDAAEDRLGYVRVKFPFPRRALFALDAYSGEVLWKIGGELFQEELKRNATFSAPPAPDGDRLYVGAVKQMYSTDPFEHYVLCLDATTGRILWSTFVASGGTEINLFGNSTRESLGSPVAVSEDSVYYVTNHGAIAALEKKTGRLRWTHRYRQLRVNPTRSVYVMKNPLEWVNSPPVVVGDTVLVTPTDSRRLMALDAKSGEKRWEVPRSNDIRSIYGVRGNTFVVGGERLEFYDVRTGKLAAPPISDELAGTGRGIVAEDGIYVPCRDKLRRVGWDGAWDEDSARPWPDATAGEGGNLLVVDGAVILATQDSVRVYFDRLDQEISIRRELARHPDDPSVAYRGALRFLQSGSGAHAARLFSRVIELTKGSRRAEDVRLARAARRRLYAASMEVGHEELQAQRLDRAAAHFISAREVAPDVRARVRASLKLGQVRILGRELSQAIGEYQDVLTRHGDVIIDGVRAFELARGAISRILETVGREAYTPWEQAASRRLAEARRRGSAEAYGAVVAGYPNSRSAETALLEVAGVYRRLDRTDDEVAALRRYLRDYPSSDRRPQVQVSLVSALERKGFTASARIFLRRMSRLDGDVEVEVNGRRVSARAHALERLKDPVYANVSGASPLPALSPPVRRRFEYTEKKFREGAPLAAEGRPPDGTAGVLVMDYGKAVKAISLETGDDVWAHATSGPIRYAAYLEGSLLVAEPMVVTRLDPLTGKVLWKYQAPAPMQHFTLSGPYLCYVTVEGRASQALAALDADRGRVAWSQTFEGIASRLHKAGDAIAFISTGPNRIHLFEADTGRRLLGNVTYTRGRRVYVKHVRDDLIVLHHEGRLMEAYSLPDGGLRWQVDLARYLTRGIGIEGDEAVILATRRIGGLGGRALMLAVDLRTGKLIRMRDGLDVGDPRYMMLDGGSAYVVSRNPDRTLRVSAVKISELSVTWSADAGAQDMTLLAPAMTQGHLILAGFAANQLGKFAYRGVLLDKRGRVVQNIAGEYRFERPPGFAVDRDRVIFSVDTKVEVHR